MSETGAGQRHRSQQALYDHQYRNEEWHPLRLRPDAWSTRRYDDVARLLAAEGGRLLEVGCGAGQLSLALAARFDRVVGLDLSPLRVERARQALRQRFPAYEGKVEFMQGDLEERLPFEDGQFDVVVACAVLANLIDVFRIVDEMARVCRPGGALVISVPNICYVKHVWHLLLGRIPLTGIPISDISYWREYGWDGGHLHYFSKPMVRDLLVDAGFVPEAWTGNGRLAKARRWHGNLVGAITVRARRGAVHPLGRPSANDGTPWRP